MKRPPDLPLIEDADTQYLRRSRRPMTPTQALMESAPGEEPDTSQLELLGLRDVLADALDEVLTPMELWVFHAVVIERLPLRHVAKQIGYSKTYLAKVRDRATAKLRDHLGDHPLVQAHLHTPPQES